MPAFWNKSNNEGDKKEVKSSAKAATKKSEPKAAAKGKNVKTLALDKSELINGVLRRPVISENAMNQQVRNKYVFEVAKDSTKSEIAKAVESFYEVSVEKVNVLVYKQKKRIFRMKAGMISGYKKAIVTVKKGDKIELFKEN